MLNRSDKFKYKIVQYKSDLPTPKRGEVVIIPEDNRLMEFAPYIAGNPLPEWWKELPKNKGSIRRCQGTYDYISYGFIIPLWTDVKIRPNSSGKDFELKLSSMDGYGQFRAEGFPADSSPSCPITHSRDIPTGHFPKIVSPWRFRTSKGVSLMVLPVLHEPDPNYTIVPGIVHTDFYNQIHIVINVLTDKEFTIPAGTPIQHMVPIRRNDDVKKIVWGNESMYKFVSSSGLGEGCLVQEDRNLFYRKKEKQIDNEMKNKFL